MSIGAGRRRCRESDGKLEKKRVCGGGGGEGGMKVHSVCFFSSIKREIDLPAIDERLGRRGE